MREITNTKLPGTENSEDEKNLYSLGLYENGIIIIFIDTISKKKSSYD